MSRPEELSAGALVFHQGPSGRRYLLLRYPAGHWDFPKGNIEKGESPEQTMIREVREETGIEGVSPVEGFMRVISYFYERDGRTVHKEVTFFLAESKEDGVDISYEHKDYAWLSYEQALKVVTYQNSLMLLREAESSFRGRSSSGSAP